ncbi:16S rRNA (adenine(1518)-N(6)/adenine(1519)-N(6))-dimethyltransferase RsmA [Candidatus Phycosocius spiralis]|uniref:Ribosomal RNA small subunit methyltransferase A n=1 Tax=Candidatus Phycosocius spiralis TaxID=2815099 RepID=A0ABQ4PSM5_9PROT|nr:16S rRNA (adenine(1518)-N(6)/adenine(1519)-N(6))-dimethyltransferase RsmA [Candidatus Phycosocius spiralis]GIU66010.1 ribosomal RNA small subunit methyltransferase A [Candidatus Phycosocius spiralis]
MSSDLRQALEANDLFAKKSLGQHFLLDLNLTGKIARLAGIQSGETVLEVGPGPGGLTQTLLESPAAQVIVIEKDARFVAHLKEFFKSYGDRLIVIEGDALAMDEASLLRKYEAKGAARLISNLPYNVGTPLLVKWLKAGDWRGPMCLMFQAEVAERICARPGQGAYGRLTVLTAARCNARLAMAVPRLAFVPPPRVESAVVVLENHDHPYADLAALEHVTAQAFGQRRKMLRASLKGLGDCEALLAQAHIDPTARPETVPPEAFFALAKAWRGVAL